MNAIYTDSNRYLELIQIYHIQLFSVSVYLPHDYFLREVMHFGPWQTGRVQGSENQGRIPFAGFELAILCTGVAHHNR